MMISRFQIPDSRFQIPECLEEEIEQVFRNVERTLKTAGTGWEHVIHVNAHHIGGIPK